MTDFELWESAVREELGFAHDKVPDLAFKTLELCLQDIEAIDDFDPAGKPYQCDYDREYKIAENNFAKADYIIYIHYYFLIYIVHYESLSFANEYDDFFQRLLMLYAMSELDISAEDINELLHKRINTYIKLANNPGEFVKRSREQLVIYLERDFLESPFCDEYPIISFFEDVDLKLKVGQHISALMNKLEFFMNKTKDSITSNADHRERNIQARAVRSIADLTIEDAADASEKALLLKYQTTLSQLKQQKEKLKNVQDLYQDMIGDTAPQSFGAKKNIQDSIVRISSQITVLENDLTDIKNNPLIKKIIDRINNQHSSTTENLQVQTAEKKQEICKQPDNTKERNETKEKSSQAKEKKESFKERLEGTYGCLGVVLYYLVSSIIAILPFVMIEANFFITLVLISIEIFIPLTSIVFWIWGLVCAIMGKQDFWTMQYYIVFAVAWLPFYIQIIKSLFRK